MPLLATLPEVPASIIAIFSCLIAGVATATSLYAMFRRENREDGQTTMQRLHRAEVAIATQEKRQEGFQGEIERVADQAKQARDAIVDNVKRDIEALQLQIKDVPVLRDLLGRLDERANSTKDEMKSLKEDVRSLAAKADRIVELLTPNK